MGEPDSSSGAPGSSPGSSGSSSGSARGSSAGVAGVLLAAGAGRRMGRPKALLRDAADVPFVDRAIGSLFAGGCATVTVVLGAAADEVRTLLDAVGWLDDDALRVVVAEDWAEGMGASFRAGLSGIPSGPPAALVTLVDLPDVGEEVIRRVLGSGVATTTLTRASYDGRVGHPVLIGSAHWDGVAGVATGDRGARDYLSTHEVLLVECGDLATGRDVDRPTDLA